MIIRDAIDSDIPGITAIYNDAVENTTAIWNETTVDESNRAAWLADRREAGFPVLVAVREGADVGADVPVGPKAPGPVLGYASYAQWRPFDGYRYTVEHSVYVRGDTRGAGIGRALMEALVVRARAAGLHAMIAGVDTSNVASIGLHESMGFRRVGQLDEVGAKFGRWLDLTFLRLALDDAPAPR